MGTTPIKWEWDGRREMMGKQHGLERVQERLGVRKMPTSSPTTATIVVRLFTKQRSADRADGEGHHRLQPRRSSPPFDPLTLQRKNDISGPFRDAGARPAVEHDVPRGTVVESRPGRRIHSGESSSVGTTRTE